MKKDKTVFVSIIILLLSCNQISCSVCHSLERHIGPYAGLMHYKTSSHLRLKTSNKLQPPQKISFLAYSNENIHVFVFANKIVLDTVEPIIEVYSKEGVLIKSSEQRFDNGNAMMLQLSFPKSGVYDIVLSFRKPYTKQKGLPQRVCIYFYAWYT